MFLESTSLNKPIVVDLTDSGSEALAKLKKTPIIIKEVSLEGCSKSPWAFHSLRDLQLQGSRV